MARFLERQIPALTKAVMQAEIPAAERAGTRSKRSSARTRPAAGKGTASRTSASRTSAGKGAASRTSASRTRTSASKATTSAKAKASRRAGARS
jgi:hypothetical protein